MPLTPAQTLLAFGLPIALAAVFVRGLQLALERGGRVDARRVVYRAVAGLAVWLALTAALALSGFLADFDARPPRIMLVMVPTLAGTVWLALSRRVDSVLASVPVAWPIGAQVFRVPVELMLWWFCAAGLIPQQMTFEGLNFDVVSGLLALPVAYGLARLGWPRGAGVAYNALGLVLLATIVTIAVMSVPGPFRVFTNEPANTLPATFPFVWLPTFLVPAALFLHIVSLRQLLRLDASAAA